MITMIKMCDIIIAS